MEISLDEAEAQLSPTGKLEWELAKAKAMIAKQQTRIAELEDKLKENPEK